MKKSKLTAWVLLGLTVCGLAVTGLAEDKKDGGKEKKAKYPLKTCLVSDEKLGEMGKPYSFQHEGKEVQLCCESCLKDFKKEPAKYMAKLEKAGGKKK